MGNDFRHQARSTGCKMGASGADSMGRSGSSLMEGFHCARQVLLLRPGFFLRTGTGSGQGLTEVPWTGQDLRLTSSYGLCATAPNTGSWKRFANVRIQMTCTPDPATGSSASPPSNPGTGVSSHDYQASINAYQPIRTISVNAVTSGSGLDARTSAPFGVYTISDTLVVNANTDTQTHVTETILLGYTDGVTNFPGTIYTIVLEGNWFNGRLAVASAAAALALNISAGVDTVWNQSYITQDSTGATVFSGGPGIIDADVAADWPSLPAGMCFGYYRSKSHITESHSVIGRDLWPIGPHAEAVTPGTFSWTINKYTVNMDGTLTPNSTLSHPTYSTDDRYIAENDGTLTLFIASGDVQEYPDTSGGFWSNSWF